MSDQDKYINDVDLRRFNLFLQGNTRAQTFYYMDDLPSVDTMFPDKVYSAILHKRNPEGNVGHWTLLIKWDENTFEYFDCLGDRAPIELQNVLDDYSELYSKPLKLHESGRQLMGKHNYICGKWVIFRLMTIPRKLDEFYRFFDVLTKGPKGKQKVSPDAIVNFIVNIPNLEH